MPGRPAIEITFAERVRYPIDGVFDFLCDLRNEPLYNGQVRDIQLSTPPPVGKGAQFAGHHVGFGPVAWTLTAYERPGHVTIEGPVGHGAYRFEADLRVVDDVTELRGRMVWTPSRFHPWIRPFYAILLRWNARRSFRRFKRVLEKRAT